MTTQTYDWRKGRTWIDGSQSSMGGLFYMSGPGYLESTQEEREWWNERRIELELKKTMQSGEISHLTNPRLNRLYSLETLARFDYINENRRLPCRSDELVANDLQMYKDFEKVVRPIAQGILGGILPDKETLNQKHEFACHDVRGKPVKDRRSVRSTVWHEMIQHSYLPVLSYVGLIPEEEVYSAFQAYFVEASSLETQRDEK